MICIECEREFLAWNNGLPEICGSCLNDETREQYKAMAKAHLERILAPTQLSKWCADCRDLNSFDCQGYTLDNGKEIDQPSCYV